MENAQINLNPPTCSHDMLMPQGSSRQPLQGVYVIADPYQTQTLLWAIDIVYFIHFALNICPVF